MTALGPHTITKGDTLEPLRTVLKNGNGNPYNLADYTVRFEMETEAGTVELATTSTGVTKHPTQNFTAATTDIITCVDHGVEDGDQIVVSNSGGALPTGLSASTNYFAINVTPNTFKVASEPGGAAIDITAAGTGTHSFYVVGSVQIDFAAAQVGTAGLFRLWITLDAGGELKTIPAGNSFIRVEVVEKGN